MSVQFVILSDTGEAIADNIVHTTVKDDDGNEKLLILSEASQRHSEITGIDAVEQNLMILSEASSQNGQNIQTLYFTQSGTDLDDGSKRKYILNENIAAQIINDDNFQIQTMEEVQVSQSKSQKRKAYTSERVFPCTVCTKKFPSTSNLKRHQRIHTGERPYQCKVCQKSYAQIDHLKRHLAVHTNVLAYTCELCDKKYQEKHRYIIHMRSHTGERPFECNICKKTFTYKVGLMKHRRVHTGERKYECDFCLKRFPESQALRIHRRIHTGERPYKCSYCEKGFSTKKSLRIHVRLHTGERPFQCDFCFKKFVSKSSLNNHTKLHTGTRPWDCKFCGRIFAQKGTLRTHIAVHMNKKSFQCEICFKRFRRRHNLLIHVKTHSAVQPYTNMDNVELKCGECDKSFAMLEAFEFHMSLHEEERAGLTPKWEKGLPKPASDDQSSTRNSDAELENPVDSLVNSLSCDEEFDPAFPDRSNSFLLMRVLEMNRPPKRQRRNSV